MRIPAKNEAAETNDRSGVYGKSFKSSHQRLSAGEVHRSLGMGNARERESEQGWGRHAAALDEATRDGLCPLPNEWPDASVERLRRNKTIVAGHWHLQRL